MIHIHKHFKSQTSESIFLWNGLISFLCGHLNFIPHLSYLQSFLAHLVWVCSQLRLQKSFVILLILVRIKGVFLCRESLCPVWAHFQGSRGIEQLPEDLDDSSRITGPEHTTSFSYPFLPQSPLIVPPALQDSVQIYLPGSSMVRAPAWSMLLWLCSQEGLPPAILLPSSPSFHVGSSTQLLLLLRWHLWPPVKDECPLCFIS